MKYIRKDPFGFEWEETHGNECTAKHINGR
jgi:hypothetical protein